MQGCILSSTEERWDSTTPTPTSEVLTSTTNWREVSGAMRIGAETKWLLRLVNAAWAALDHLNTVLVDVKANWRNPETSAGPCGNLKLAILPQAKFCQDPYAAPQTKLWTPKKGLTDCLDKKPILEQPQTRLTCWICSWREEEKIYMSSR